jgi:predicted dehydrogenase
MGSTRRHFLQTTTAVGLGLPALAAAADDKKTSANDNVQIALIGAGGMGSGDVETALKVKGVKMVAACDIYDGRRERAKEQWGSDLFTTREYQEILARPGIDAVIIGTSDHWHAQIAIDAMKAGKDVYVEKPMVQKIEDGHRMIEAQKATGRIVQAGSQYYESMLYAKARQLLKEGAIGQLNMVEAWWDRNSAQGAWEYSVDPNASPANIDWNRFLGPAPKHEFDPVRLFRWRTYQDYGTGIPGDLFVHLFTTLHYVTGSPGPTRVFGTGGLRYWKDGRDVPDVVLGLYDYPESSTLPPFNLRLRVNFVNGSGDTSGFRFVGSEGIISIGHGLTLTRTPREVEPGYTIETFPKAVQEAFKKQYEKEYPPEKMAATGGKPDTVETFYAPRSDDAHLAHHRDFINSVRTRKPLYEDPTTGLRAAGPALATNLSYFEQKAILWDPQTMTVKG